MAMKKIFRIAVLAATLLAAASCIYPFKPELARSGEYPLVVEGDIHLGGETTLILSHVVPFDTEDYVPETIRAQAYIEGEDGTRIEGKNDPLSGDSSLYYISSTYPSGSTRCVIRFDTSGMTKVQRYRLHFDTTDALGQLLNSFESDWLDPCPAPTIERLSYSKQEDYDELWIGLSMHCNGAHHFRWTFSEVWEYHSDIYTHLKYDPATRSVVNYDFGEPNLYYCWNSATSGQINIFSTANQTEDRFEDLAFHTIPLTNQRLQIMYHITVRLEAMSENAYNYWYNIQQNTSGQGDIFAPMPSEMASNVHCLTDPSLQVLGYLNAAFQTEGDLYYDNAANHFYKSTLSRFQPDEKKVSASRPDSLEYWYKHYYLPYDELYEGMSADPTHYMWARDYCIDCRRQGGTKQKPAGWPNDDI